MLFVSIDSSFSEVGESYNYSSYYTSGHSMQLLSSFFSSCSIVLQTEEGYDDLFFFFDLGVRGEVLALNLEVRSFNFSSRLCLLWWLALEDIREDDMSFLVVLLPCLNLTCFLSAATAFDNRKDIYCCTPDFLAFMISWKSPLWS